MPLPLENTIETPNALYFPQIIINTSIIGGRLKTGVQILLSPAKAENNIWTKTSSSQQLFSIPDVSELPDDLAELSPQIQAMYDQIVTLIGQINSIRKIV
jgi:hypothetical protein